MYGCIQNILKLLGVKTEKNIHDTTEVHERQNITFDLGKNTNNFVDLDGFRRRICGYRFALESLIENGTKYQDRFLQTKYLEIILANNVRRKLEGQIATEAIMNETLDDSAERLRRYFRFLNESEITDIKSNANSVAQVNGGLDNMINWEGKDKDLLALIKYTADEDKLEKVLENPQVIKTPVVRNGNQSTLGYQPYIWKGWN